jgi:hypothetical protein
MISPFDLFIVYISWGIGGKSRPVLVLSKDETTVDVFPVTTQYADKSDAIKANYFKITEWSKAGLDKESYVDTGTVLEIPLKAIENKSPIGKLTVSDKLALLAFLSR